MEIVPATREHIDQMYDCLPATVRAFAVVDNGKVHGVAGIYSDGIKDVIFAKMDEEMKRNKKMIVRAARKVIELSSKGVIYAIQDKCLDTSESFIKHFGFEHVESGVYRWKR